MQILSFASGVVALPAPVSIGFDRMMAVAPLATMFPVESVVTVVGVDVDECCSRPSLDNVVTTVAAAVDKSDPALTDTELDWAMLEMIMSLRFAPVATRGVLSLLDGPSAVGSDDAICISGNFFGLNKRIMTAPVRDAGLVCSMITSSEKEKIIWRRG